MDNPLKPDQRKSEFWSGLQCVFTCRRSLYGELFTWPQHVIQLENILCRVTRNYARFCRHEKQDRWLSGRSSATVPVQKKTHIWSVTHISYVFVLRCLTHAGFQGVFFHPVILVCCSLPVLTALISAVSSWRRCPFLTGSRTSPAVIESNKTSVLSQTMMFS